MLQRMDETVLESLHDAAIVGAAHPTDVLRLVEEVRWYRQNRYVLANEGEFTQHVRELQECDKPEHFSLEKTQPIRDEYRRRWTEVFNAIIDGVLLVDGEAGRRNLRAMKRDASIVAAIDMYVRNTGDAAQVLAAVVYVLWKERNERITRDLQIVQTQPPMYETGCWNRVLTDAERKEIVEWMEKQGWRVMSSRELYAAGLTPPPPSYMYKPPGPNERYEQQPNSAVGMYYCTLCGNVVRGFNDGTQGGSASMWSFRHECVSSPKPMSAGKLDENFNLVYDTYTVRNPYPHNNGTILPTSNVCYDWQGRALIPVLDEKPDGVNVVVTDRGVMKYVDSIVSSPKNDDADNPTIINETK